MRYVCRCCGWIYDEEQGEFGCDIDPNTSFDELPEGFECPECYSDKNEFHPIEE